ncbi:MAG: glycoside hydrolase family 78 protein [Spirochaetia bacterium]|nr:glycoside hydrolase family 78 protein [Spirochaetia bacterium]
MGSCSGPYDDLPVWETGWITGDCTEGKSPLLIKDIAVPDDMSSCMLVISGLGYYKAWLDGVRIGDGELEPAQTDYEQRLFYQVFDVTGLVQGGRMSRLGIHLGNGWYHQSMVWGPEFAYGIPKANAAMIIKKRDGSFVTLGTGADWMTKSSAVLQNNIYAGEHFDARLHDREWATTSDRGWSPAAVTSPPGGRMELQRIPPIRKMGSLDPIQITQPQHHHIVYDFGQNMAGWVRLQSSFPSGTVITMRFAEDIGTNGQVDTSSTGVFATGTEQIDRYVCSGSGEESWEPSFCYHGFRYVEVTLEPQELDRDIDRHLSLKAFRLFTDLSSPSCFSSRHPMVNAVWDLVRRALESNLHGLLTDCPARERCGWLGDTHLLAETLIYSYDAKLFLEKILDDIETTRNGGVPWDIAPGRRTCLQGCPDWIAAAVIIPWEMYQQYGDLELLKTHYDCMHTVIDHVHSLSVDGVVSEGRGDWCPPGAMVDTLATPPALQNTALFSHTAWVMAQTAALLGRGEESSRFQRWHEESKQACIRVFYTDANGFGSQSADAMLLDLRLVPGSLIPSVRDDLVRRTEQGDQVCYTVGAFGARHLFKALSDAHRDDLVYKLLVHEGYPGYLELMQQGATTLWENWEKVRPDAPVCVKRSMNHHMHGGFGAWFFAYLAGIQVSGDHPGYSRFCLAPRIFRLYGGIVCRYASVQGIIESSWQFHDELIHWQVTIPAGTRALLTLPTIRAEVVREKGMIVYQQQDDRPFSLDLGSGDYYLIIEPAGGEGFIHV